MLEMCFYYCPVKVVLLGIFFARFNADKQIAVERFGNGPGVRRIDMQIRTIRIS